MQLSIVKTLLTCSAVLLISVTPLQGNPALADQNDGFYSSNEMKEPNIFPPGLKTYGKKMSEWSAEWWQYILSIPQDPNPLLDMTGECCTLAQHGPVWFLAGVGAVEGVTAAERAVTLPEGKALFIPLINLVNINATDQPVDELRAEIAGCMNAVTDLSLQIDGEALPLEVLKRSRVQSVPFEVVYPQDGVPVHPHASAAIYSPAVADGYYVMLKPLPVGEHTVHFSGASAGCAYAPTGFYVDPWSVEVTYHLTVVPVTLH